MKPGLNIGDTYSFSITVTNEMTAQFGGIQVHQLYSTASMITHMEWAARQHILPFLETGEEGVGYHIDIQHKFPVPVGQEMTITSSVTEINGPLIQCAVQATCLHQTAGCGTITQAVINLKDFDARVDSLQSKTNSSSSEDTTLIHSNELHPATLWSEDLKSTLVLRVKDAYTKNVCTIYDEAMLIEGTLRYEGNNDETGYNLIHEGPFLVRYEIEEIADNLEKIIKGTQSEYHSNTIEGIFNIKATGNPEHVLITITFTPPEAPNNEALTLNCPSSSIVQFTRMLRHQLEAFPSLL